MDGPGRKLAEMEPGSLDDRMNPRTRGAWRLQFGPVLSWTVLLLGLVASLALFRLPGALPEKAPPEAFSATRAMPHVAAIAREAHPSGSPAQARVQDYVFREVAELGLEPVDQEAVASIGNGTAALRNILVRLPGTRSSGAILLLTHTDSTRHGPGAQDNATGVAVLLELLRAMVSIRPAVRCSSGRPCCWPRPCSLSAFDGCAASSRCPTPRSVL